MKISVIGACNIDITTKLSNDIKLYDSNLSKIKMSMGGVGRNVANNLSLLGQDVSMFTAISNDNFGQMIKDHSNKRNIDLSNAIFSNDYSQSIYLCVNDKQGDLIIGANDMDIINLISIDYLKEKLDILNNSDCVVFDTNLTSVAIEYLSTNITKPCFVDTVSITKAEKLADVLNKTNVNIYALKTNKLECEVLTGIKIEKGEDFIRSSKYLHEKGITNVCISLGSKGVFYSTPTDEYIVPAKEASVVSTNGAGDAFLAGMIYAYSKNAFSQDVIKYGLSAAKITCESENAVSENMNVFNLENEFNK